MSNFYKIEGENESALFRGNLDRLRQLFESDPNWVAGVMEIAQHYGISKGMQNFRNSLFGCKVEERGDTYFEVRGTVSLYYRVEAISGAVSRITPIAKMPMIHKIFIPIQLALVCLFPVVLTPLFYMMQKRKIEWNSKAHIEPLCQYLEMRVQSLQGQGSYGELN